MSQFYLLSLHLNGDLQQSYSIQNFYNAEQLDLHLL